MACLEFTHILSASLSLSLSAVSLGGWWPIRLSDKFRWGPPPTPPSICISMGNMAEGERRPDPRWHEQTASCQTHSPLSSSPVFFPPLTFDFGSFLFSLTLPSLYLTCLSRSCAHHVHDTFPNCAPGLLSQPLCCCTTCQTTSFCGLSQVPRLYTVITK